MNIVNILKMLPAAALMLCVGSASAAGPSQMFIWSDSARDWVRLEGNSSGAISATTTLAVIENAATATAVDVDAADSPDDIVITIDVGAVNATRLTCMFLNTNTAADATIDEVNIFLNPAGVVSTENVHAYTEADFAAPSGYLLFVRTGAPGGDADAVPDTTVDETDVLTVGLDVGGWDNVVFSMSASAEDAKVNVECTYN